MIRLRKVSGEVLELPSDVAAVEVCSSDGKLGAVLIPGSDGKVTLLEPDDEELRAYARAVKAEVSQIINLD